MTDDEHLDDVCPECERIYDDCHCDDELPEDDGTW